ncbi:MAG: aminoglycoside phosphotransferase family protein [Firmicutes bacterium]|nr:aminoglycoside phosphotransferase family protein [Bacillota bacterium]
MGNTDRPNVDIVRTKIARIWPDLADMPVDWIDRGERFDLVFVGSDWVVRIARRHADQWRLRREMWLLAQLSAAAPWALPTYDGPAVGGYARYRYLQGVPFRPGSALPEALGGDIRAFLEWLHGRMVAASPKDAKIRWLRRYRAWVNQLAPDVMPLFSVRERRKSQERLDEGLRLLESGPWEVGLIHGNVLPRHLLVSGGRLAGVVDFSQWRVGDAAVDWSGIEGLEEFLSPALAADHLFAARIRFYRFLRPFLDIRQALSAGQVEAVERGVQWVRRQLSQ